MIVKRGVGYHVEWYTETDTLQLFVAGVREPTAWEPINHGIEVGTVGITPSYPPPNEGAAPDGSCRSRITLRMTNASWRQPLLSQEVQALADSNGVRLGMLTMLLDGHVEFLTGSFREDHGIPLSLPEAADKLAATVRDSMFGDTRTVDRLTAAAGFDDPREWLEAALDTYFRARKFFR